MADVNISKYRASVVREGSKPATPGFVVSEGQDPVNPPGTNNFVPYSGAISNVELGEFGLETGFVTLDTTPTNIPVDQGAIYWDDAKSTAALIMNGTIQHIGQDTFFYVKNSSGSSIPKGTCVRFAGTDGASGHLLVVPFLANGSVPSTYFMGVTAEEITNGSFGQVMHFGELTGIDTSGFTAGSLLYASSTVAGAFQTTAPTAPNNIVLVAAAVNSKNNGAIVVRPTYGSNINDDEGVKITSPTTGQLLQLQASGLWENKTKAQVLGGTSSQFVKGDGSLDSTSYQPLLTNPVTGTGTTNYLPKFTGASTIGNSQIFDNGTFVGIGTNNPASKLEVYAASPSTVFDAHLTLQSSETTGAINTGGALQFSSHDGENLRVIASIRGLKENSTVGNYSGYISFSTRLNGASPSEKMRITSSGNLLVGTTSDNGARLQVSGNQTLTGKLLINSTDTTKTPLLLNSEGNYASSGNMTTGFAITNTSFGRALNMGVFESGAYAWVQAAYINNADTTFPLALQPRGGNVGIGTSSPAVERKLTVAGGAQFTFASNSGASFNIIPAANGQDGADFNLSYYTGSAYGPLNFIVGESNRLRINPNGNVLIGTTTDTGHKLTTAGDINITTGAFRSQGEIVMRRSGNEIRTGSGDGSDYLVYYAGASERMRITSNGFLKASNNGTYLNGSYNEINSNTNNQEILYNYHSGTNPYGVHIYFNSAPNNGSNYFQRWRDGNATRAWLYSNGGFANFQANDTNLSDERVKKDIISLESYWDKFKAIEIVKFKYKDQTHEDFNIGVIAQQIESVAPEFVDIDGWGENPKNEEPLKSIYTADLYHATIKVLQEAMAKIETMQKEIDTLKN